MAALVLVLFKVLAAVFFVQVAVLSGAGVSAQTHHVVGGDGGGWGPDFNVTSWLAGRVFRVGDKIWFKHSAGAEEKIVEVESPEEFQSCNLNNPIRMYTDPVSHVALEKEGVRYFTSANPDACLNGLKLPVAVVPLLNSTRRFRFRFRFRRLLALGHLSLNLALHLLHSVPLCLLNHLLILSRLLCLILSRLRCLILSPRRHLGPRHLPLPPPI
ncbi:UNVERIFIED_CONTAM: hypothetical protein Sradi_6018300 [Sesamum radiatum]|uniref:Phytocyanin domain-containing protein n=1 Tax=Sesamum radiatum TaxID=300843 RepID=A0AAW2KJJ6_SESRA